MFTFRLAVALVLLCEQARSDIFSCPPNQDCVVNCTHTGIPSFSCSNSIIKGANASSLNVYCSGTAELDKCDNMKVECPITTNSNNEITCNLHCDYENACTNTELWAHNTQSVNLNCGFNTVIDKSNNAIDSICQNVTIEGTYDEVVVAPVTQSININCNVDEANITNAICDGITTRNIGSYSNVVPLDFYVTLTVDCIHSDDTCVACTNLNINSGKAKAFEFYIGGFVEHSNFDLTDPILQNVNIQLYHIGRLETSIFDALNVQNKITLNGSSTNAEAAIREVAINGDHGKTQFDILLLAPTYVNALTAQGRLNIDSNALFEWCQFVSIDASDVNVTIGGGGGWIDTTLDVSYATNTALVFKGDGASGTIHAEYNGQISVVCDAKHGDKGCAQLSLYMPEYTEVNDARNYHAFLECINYGCNEVNVYSEHAFGDVSVNVARCKCKGNDESCIGKMFGYCGSDESDKVVFDGVECDNGDAESSCCGDIVQETKQAICKNNNGNNSSGSNLNAGEVAGVVVGLVIGIGIIVCLTCYCMHQKTLRDQFRNSQIQSILEEQESAEHDNVRKGSISVTSGAGYGSAGFT